MIITYVPNPTIKDDWSALTPVCFFHQVCSSPVHQASFTSSSSSFFFSSSAFTSSCFSFSFSASQPARLSTKAVKKCEVDSWTVRQVIGGELSEESFRHVCTLRPDFALALFLHKLEIWNKSNYGQHKFCLQQRKYTPRYSSL